MQFIRQLADLHQLRQLLHIMSLEVHALYYAGQFRKRKRLLPMNHYDHPILPDLQKPGYLTTSTGKGENFENDHSTSLRPGINPNLQKPNAEEPNPEAGVAIAEKNSGKGSAAETSIGSTHATPKGEKIGKPMVAVTNKKSEKKSGKLGAGLGSLAGTAIKVLSNSKVAKYLIIKGSPILQKGLSTLQHLLHLNKHRKHFLVKKLPRPQMK